MTNNAVKLLFEDLTENFGIKYLLTYRINQDVFENFFDVMRYKGGLHDHPDPLVYRLKNYILDRNEGSLSEGGNVEDDVTPDAPKHNIKETLLSGNCFSKLSGEVNDQGRLLTKEFVNELMEESDDLKQG
jgi:hypothetical protein